MDCPKEPEGPDRRALEARAEELAKILMRGQVGDAARMLSEGALKSLPREIGKEQGRWNRSAWERRRRRENPRRRRTMRLGVPQLFQLLVFELATQVDATQLPFSPESGSQNRTKLTRYLVRLAACSMRTTSRTATVLFKAFVYDCPTGAIASYQEFLIGGEHSWEPSYIDNRRRVYCERLQSAFPDSLRQDEGYGRTHRFIPDDRVDVREVERLLAALAPWDGRCELPPEEGPVNPKLGHRLPDLHSEVRALTDEEDPQLELNRVYAVIEPHVHEQICRRLVIERKFVLPKFFGPEDTRGEGNGG